ncbi:MAG: ABC-2 type transport system ATP-binding protein [Verrucomicrobiales bacterium]|jgi:ABC-2 type transport system ATP-binding protein
MAETPVLRVRNLVKEFGKFRAVDGLSLDVKKGEILGLLGANGAGKTTTMHLLLGLTTPTSGEIEVFGKSLHKNRIELMRRMNFSSAYTNLPGNLLVRQNLMIFGMMYGVKKSRERAQQLLELFEIEHLAKRPTGYLSAGEATKVNLCKAFLNSPDLLMLDEPTASLDPDVADKTRKLIRKLQKEQQSSIVYTSHNMRDIEEICDRVIFIHRGKIIREGTPENIKDGFEETSLEEVFIKIARGGDLFINGNGEEAST